LVFKVIYEMKVAFLAKTDSRLLLARFIYIKVMMVAAIMPLHERLGPGEPDVGVESFRGVAVRLAGEHEHLLRHAQVFARSAALHIVTQKRNPSGVSSTVYSECSPEGCHWHLMNFLRESSPFSSATLPLFLYRRTVLVKKCVVAAIMPLH
jgi:hypothetical protein